jgi:hypothetical protein
LVFLSFHIVHEPKNSHSNPRTYIFLLLEVKTDKKENIKYNDANLGITDT